MQIELIDQKRTGLLPEHRGFRVEQETHSRVRLTIPAREALVAAGATVTPEPLDVGIGMPTYAVTLGDTVPAGLIVAATNIQNQTGYGHYEVLSLRMEIEPPYPGECVGDYWRRLDFSTCPKCGAPLVWYEAGHVPGYRVCAKKPHHHWLAGGEE